MSLRGNIWELLCDSKPTDILTLLGELRGVDDLKKFTQLDFERDLHDPDLLPDGEKAVERICAAITNKERIMVFGDYDADGITAAALLVDMLTRVGGNVIYRLPHRIRDGYGFKKHIAEEAEEKQVSLIITADCGVSNYDSIVYAKEVGIDVIVTDHHAIPEQLPPALAIIHPAVPQSEYPYKGLCGAGVAYKLCHLLSRKYWNKQEREHWLKWSLDLVAIGTVADCSDLLGENRIFVSFGLQVLSKTKRIGLRQLYTLAGINENSSWDPVIIGYRIAPRLNAAGRLDDPEVALELLLTKDTKKAQALAQYIHDLNTKRQELTEVHFDEAVQSIKDEKGKASVCLYNPAIPAGIIGLIAGKLSQSLNVPVIVITEVNGKAVGSARSIEAIDLMQYLPTLQEYFEEFGGHAQAAGFSMSPENVAPFKEAFLACMQNALSSTDIIRKVTVDCALDFSEIDARFVGELKLLEPYGMRNEKPRFLSTAVKLEMIRLVGSNSQHLKCTLKQDGTSFQAICFNAQDIIPQLNHTKLYDIIYTIERNTWNGNTRTELQLLDFRLVN